MEAAKLAVLQKPRPLAQSFFVLTWRPSGTHQNVPRAPGTRPMGNTNGTPGTAFARALPLVVHVHALVMSHLYAIAAGGTARAGRGGSRCR